MLNKTVSPYESFKNQLNQNPFIIIIGKYDQILGPRALYSSAPVEEKQFFTNLLRDALNTKNKLVILDFNHFYAQVCKVEIKDASARGGKQLYAIILLRHKEFPLIPSIHFKRIEMAFHKIGRQKILDDDEEAFEAFFKEIMGIYMRKDELLPLESVNLQIRTGINTIQGFCELILEENGNLSESDVKDYVKMMLDSCQDITEALKSPFSQISDE